MTYAVKIQFCDNTALIHCPDERLYQDLSRYFRHCLSSSANPTSIVVTYHITCEAGQWQLWQADKLIHIAPTAFFIFMFLSRNVIAKLVNQCQDRLVFHAAALAYGQQGVILCNQSNSGKSTLAAWLTAKGFGFLADDIMAVGFEPFEATGFTCPIVLNEGSKFVWENWLSTEVIQQQIDFFGGTAWIDPTLFAANNVQTAVPPRLLIFPTYAAEQSFSPQQPSTAEVIFRLMPRLVNFANFPNRGVTEITHFARQIQAYELVYNDVVTAAAWIEQKVGELGGAD